MTEERSCTDGSATRKSSRTEFFWKRWPERILFAIISYPHITSSSSSSSLIGMPFAATIEIWGFSFLEASRALG
jgi:hypothetical protein